jgi:hypothetical protein
LSSPHIEKLDIVVGDFPADATLINHKGVRTLFMRPQTFSSAVRHVRNVLPGITLEAAEQMVREQCPEFRDFDDLLGLTDPTPPSVERPPAEPTGGVVKAQLPGKRRRKAFLVAALLPALAASWALGRYTNVVDSGPAETKASAPDATPDAADAVDAPFADKKFDFFAGASDIECDPISTLEAECTDADGMVMSTKAATGPDSTIFTFSYGSERIGLRIFYDADYAETWARQDGSRELYPHMKVHDRYVLWGTDPKRIGEYMDLLQQSVRDAGPSALGAATPLPPRLAALTLGTLGLDRQQVNQIIARPAMAVTDAPAMVAARLVLGLDTSPVWTGHDGDDIVALALGIERPPATGNGGGTVVVPISEPAPVPTTPPTDSGSGSTTSPTAPTTPPPTDTTTPTEPATPRDTTPPATTPTPPEQTPADPATTEPPIEETPTTPVEETPTTPVEETPAEETPTPPVEETPAPPAEETPAPPVEETPAPVETPAEGATPPGQETAPPVDTVDQDDAGDDLLILDSAWTVSAA